MGMFDSVTGVKEKGIQLLLRDDRKFKFRKLLIEDNSLLEKDSAGQVINGWYMRYKLLKPFSGYKKKISAGMVTVCYSRDILLDFFNQLAEKEKPEKGNRLIKKFITEIAEAKCYKHEKITPSFFADKMVLFMGSAIVILALMVGLKIAISRGG